MGGMLICASIYRDPDAAVGESAHARRVGRACAAWSASALIGFWDDYTKVERKRNLGLTATQKFMLRSGWRRW